MVCYPAGKTGNYTIPNGAMRIADYAFYDCAGLTSVLIPESVTYIGSDAFYRCDNLLILCYPDSAAENYAINQGIPYISVENITGISVKTLPNKTVYPIGGKLVTRGLKLTVSYADHTSVDITRGYEVGDYDFSTAGVKTITASLLDFTATFDVTVDADLMEYPASDHPYAAGTDKTWYYTHPTDAAALKITFSEDTETEENCDYIVIYDGDGNWVGDYTGKDLAGRTVTVPGNSFSIKLISDGSVNYYGFAIVDIQEKVAPEHIYLESDHPYDEYSNQTWYYTHETAAESLDITFSDDTETEEGYDYIYIYDGDGNLVGEYTGTELMDRTVTVPGNSFSIQLTSDSSVNYYGFAIVDIKANVSYDPNGDGSIDSADLTELKRALLSGEDGAAYDLNADGYFDVRDLVHLKKYLVN